MKKENYRRVQFLSHLSIILIALLFVFVVVKQTLISPAPEIISAPRNADTPEPAAGRRPPPKTTPVGNKMPIESVNWAKKKQTLVLYLSSTCRYCNESIPLYRKLIKEKSKLEFEMIAVLSQNPEEARDYLKAQNLDIPDVFSTSLSSLGVTATPTLLLVNHDGLVTDFWRGKLNAEKEAEVLAKLAS